MKMLEAVSNGDKIDKSTTVLLPIAQKATIYGFVPYNEESYIDIFLSATEKDLDCPQLGRADVVGNRIISNITGNLRRFPIFSSVEKPKEEKYPVELLYLPKLNLLPKGWNTQFKAYREIMKTGKLQGNLAIKAIDGMQIIEDKAFYIPKDDEFIFTSPSKFYGIANAFTVITRRISIETGTMVYETSLPSELEIIDNEV